MKGAEVYHREVPTQSSSLIHGELPTIKPMLSFREALLAALIFFLYLGAALWGLSLHAVGGFATLVWPPTGIAIAVLYFGGNKYWLPIALGSLIANTITGAPPLVAALIAA